MKYYNNKNDLFLKMAFSHFIQISTILQLLQFYLYYIIMQGTQRLTLLTVI